MCTIFYAAIVALIATAPVADNEQWGDLTGRFVYDGLPPAVPAANPPGFGPIDDESLAVDAEGGLKNVVIYLRSADVDVHPTYRESIKADAMLVFNKQGQFEPRVLPLLVNQKLVIKNLHPRGAFNPNISPLGDITINGLIPPGAQVETSLSRQQSIPVKATCNIHPWVVAHILPRNTPYVAVSGSDGRFELKNLAAGTWEFQVWHEIPGFVARPEWNKGRFFWLVKPGSNSLGTIKLKPTLFQSPK